MRALRSLLIVLCVLVGTLTVSPNAMAGGTGSGLRVQPPPGDLPDECTFEDGDLGHYIVLLQDWVEDPGVVARDQVERYGGNLGFVYTSAIKGYSAEYPPESARILQAEPTVDHVSIDELIWMDESSGFIQWRSCPLAPPLGPPPEEPEEPEEPEQPEEPEEPEPGVPGSAAEDSPQPSRPNDDGIQSSGYMPLPVTSGLLPAALKGAPPAKRCGKGKKKPVRKKNGRCARKRAHAVR